MDLLPGLLDNVSESQVARSGLPLPWVLTVLQHLKYDFDSWYWVPLTCGFVLCLVYLFRGGMSHQKGQKASNSFLDVTHSKCLDLHAEVIAPNLTVWIVFASVVFGTLLLATHILVDLQQQLDGQQPLIHTLTSATNRIKPYARLVDQQDDSIAALVNTEGINATQWLAAKDQLFGIRSHALALQHVSQRLIQSLQAAANDSVATGSTAGGAAGKPHTTGQLQLTSWLAEVSLLSTEVLSATESILREKARLHRRSPAAASIGQMQRSTAASRCWRTALPTFEALDTPVTLHSAAPFITVAILYAIFLFLPWLIYFSYLFSKRRRLCAQPNAILRILAS